jgi:hypothetical protein
MEALLDEELCSYTCGKTPFDWVDFRLPTVSELENRFSTATAKLETA